MLAGALVAFVGAVVLGEYVVTVGTGLVAGVIVPLAVAEAVGLVAGQRGRPWPHLAAAGLGGGGVALGVWFGTGRGLQPWPLAGTVAVIVAAAWPLARAAFVVRSRPVS
jgi:hypothetical protein